MEQGYLLFTQDADAHTHMGTHTPVHVRGHYRTQTLAPVVTRSNPVPKSSRNPSLGRQAQGAALYLFCLVTVIATGLFGRTAMETSPLLGWSLLGYCVGLIACGAYCWDRRAKRARRGDR